MEPARVAGINGVGKSRGEFAFTDTARRSGVVRQRVRHGGHVGGHTGQFRRHAGTFRLHASKTLAVIRSFATSGRGVNALVVTGIGGLLGAAAGAVVAPVARAWSGLLRLGVLDLDPLVLEAVLAVVADNCLGILGVSELDETESAGALRAFVDHDDAIDDLAVGLEVLAEMRGGDALAEATNKNLVRTHFILGHGGFDLVKK